VGLLVGLIFCGAYACWLHSFQPSIDEASIQVLKVLDTLPVHAIHEHYISREDEYFSPSVHLANINNARSGERESAVVFAFLGDNRKITLNLEFPYRVNVWDEFVLNSSDCYQIIGSILDFKLNRDFARVLKGARDTYSQRNDVHPLSQGRFLQDDAPIRRLRSLPRFYRLPANHYTRQASYHDQPPIRVGPPTGPLDGCVPGWRVAIGFGLICVAVLIFICGVRTNRYWLCACAYGLFVIGSFVWLTGHTDCRDQQTEYRQTFQH